MQSKIHEYSKIIAADDCAVTNINMIWYVKTCQNLMFKYDLTVFYMLGLHLFIGHKNMHRPKY